MSDNKLRNQIEALLFSSGKNMDIDNIAGLTHSTTEQVLVELQALKQEYDDRNTALMIISEGTLWKIHVREEYLDLVRKIVSDTELGKAVLETLAVIAYKSPVMQADVIKIRSGQAYEHIGQLAELGFVSKEKSGRSYVLKITEKFNEYFDIDKNQQVSEIFDKLKVPKEKEPVDASSETTDPDRTGTEGEETTETQATLEENNEKPSNDALDEIDKHITEMNQERSEVENAEQPSVVSEENETTNNEESQTDALNTDTTNTEEKQEDVFEKLEELEKEESKTEEEKIESDNDQEVKEESLKNNEKAENDKIDEIYKEENTNDQVDSEEETEKEKLDPKQE